MFVAWNIETTDEFQAWWAGLSEAEHEVITVGVTVLEEKGPALGRPLRRDFSNGANQI
jgi:hypothetical protein